MNEEERIWLQIFCAAISGQNITPYSTAEMVTKDAASIANRGLEKFRERFPKGVSVKEGPYR